MKGTASILHAENLINWPLYNLQQMLYFKLHTMLLDANAQLRVPSVWQVYLSTSLPCTIIFMPVTSKYLLPILVEIFKSKQIKNVLIRHSLGTSTGLGTVSVIET